MNLEKKYHTKIEELSNLKGIFAVYLFGSYSKNKAKNNSDLDVCFIMDENEIKTEDEILSNNTKEFDSCVFHRLSLHHKFEILKNGKIISTKDKNKFSEIRLKTAKQYRRESHILRNMIKKRHNVEI